MLHPLTKLCADMNTEFCPCLLAETNGCVFCSKLQGKDVCDCNWGGVCIFYEKYWQDKSGQKKRQMERFTEETAILRQEPISTKAYRLEFFVSEKLAERLDRPGAFVFLRRVCDPQCSHFPVGVMKAEAGRIAVVIEAVGAKSGRFLLNREEKISVRGPYYNGLLGSPWLKELQGGDVAVIAGGIGQAPAVPIIKALLANENRVHLIAAPGKLETAIFIQKEICAPRLTIHPVASLRAAGFSLLEELLRGKVDLLVSAGPDAQHNAAVRAMRDAGVNVPMAATNNAVMCCGEGLCGSCSRLTQEDKAVKMCKTQLDYQKIMLE